jgi:hypothetical protein
MGMHGRGGYNETDRARGCKDLPSTHVRLLTQAYRMRRKPCATAMCQGRGVMCLAASPAHKQTSICQPFLRGNRHFGHCVPIDRRKQDLGPPIAAHLAWFPPFFSLVACAKRSIYTYRGNAATKKRTVRYTTKNTSTNQGKLALLHSRIRVCPKVRY